METADILGFVVDSPFSFFLHLFVSSQKAFLVILCIFLKWGHKDNQL